MKYFTYTFLYFLILNSTLSVGQTVTETKQKHSFKESKLTIEPAIGLKPYPMSDALISNLIQWNIKSKISLISYSAYSYNNAFDRNFNHIKTEYNNTFNQNFGIGTTFYSKRSSHTVSFLAGVKYDSYKETLENPEFENATMAISSIAPDFGLMYNLKVGMKKYFFSYRMYIPLSPYPFQTTDILSTDGNMANLTMEFGIGFRIK